MDPLVWLLLLSVAMLVGSYVAGSVPLSIKLSEKNIRLFNALGAGLLIGTSLMVVIPEGVETIYNAVQTTLSSSVSSTQGSTSNWVEEEQNINKRSPTEEEEEGGEHTAIGLALIFGFTLMFIIDQVSSLHLPAFNNNNSSVEYTELDTVVVGIGSLQNEDEEEEEEEQQRRTPTSAATAATTPALTVGLVVHAAADGIALGASATHPQLSIVVFLAIMLHKAPASFALTSVLLAGGLSHVEIRKHLALFAFAAPTGALLTYLILHLLLVGSFLQANLDYWTGVLLVFSGGTFLYVAMHALQEVSHTHNKDESRTQLLVILAGMTVPVLLSMTHSH